jgi:sulfonate transport system permease protein
MTIQELFLRDRRRRGAPSASLPAPGAPTGRDIVLVQIRPTAKSKRWRPPRSLRRAIGPVSVLILWWLLNVTGAMPSSVLAGPEEVLKAGWQLIENGQLPSAMGVSAERVAEGFLLGAVIGTVLAVISGLFRIGEDIVDSTVGMLRTLPWVGLIPLFIIWFGIDQAPKVALVALAVTFPLYMNIYAGIRGVDAQLIEAATMLGLRRRGLIMHVVLPGALPGVLVGVRYALGNAWLALVFAEQVNASNGIGALMNTAEENYQTDIIVVCLVVYAILGLFTDLIVRLLMRYALAWRPSFEGTGR